MKIFQACFITLVAVFVVEANAQTTVLRAGHLVDPATGIVSANQTILIEGPDITRVGSDVDVPNGAQVIDLSDSWVFPGLMDAHTHLS